MKKCLIILFMAIAGLSYSQNTDELYIHTSDLNLSAYDILIDVDTMTVTDWGAIYEEQYNTIAKWYSGMGGRTQLALDWLEFKKLVWRGEVSGYEVEDFFDWLVEKELGAVVSKEVATILEEKPSDASTVVNSIQMVKDKDGSYESLYIEDSGKATQEKTVEFEGGITEYFINPNNIGEIEFIFVFEAPRRIIGYKAGFKSVFDLEYTESPWSRPEERRLETIFGVFQFTVAGDIGTIRCNETTWEVVNVVTFGN